MLSALVRGNVRPLVPDFIRPWTILRGGAGAFARKIVVDFKVRDYRVKTVESPAELKQVLALRRAVFHYEFAGKWLSLRSDQDVFDEYADHLAIFDEKAGVVAGVYRLISSASSRNFYSSTEFDTTRFMAQPGVKLELSRACIDSNYRNGVVISLLWRGIADYAKKADADFLFGLSSINTTDVQTIAAIHRHFAATGLLHDEWSIAPRAKYEIADFAATLAKASPDGANIASVIPTLFKTYIKAGAKVCSQPVIDRDFNCADWLIALNMRHLVKAYDRRFMGG